MFEIAVAQMMAAFAKVKKAKLADAAAAIAVKRQDVMAGYAK